ncbi:MAG TPA: HAMP domain-containing sensor histidine kinase [Clostridium sp.]
MNKLRKKFKIKSLQWQLILGFFIILVILLSIMGISQYKQMKEYLYTSKVQSLQQKFHSINLDELNEKKLDNDESSITSILTGLTDRDTGVAFLDKSGQVKLKFQQQEENKLKKEDSQDLQANKEKSPLVVSIPELSSENYIEVLNKEGNLEKTYEVIEDVHENYQLIVWRKVGDMSSPSGLIQLSTPINDIESILNKQISISIIGSIVVLVIGLILGKAIFKRTLTPLYNITNTVEGIDVKELDIRLSEENGQFEIDRLAKSFNIMLKRIETSFKEEQCIKEKMRRFVSDASHELRTPLTSIHGFVEILLRGAAKNEDQLNLALNSMLIESERLTKLVNDLLIITKLEQEPIVEMNRENLKAVIEEIVPQLEILAENRKLQIELKDNIMVYVNKDQIKQVIFNLTQNAVLHTDKIESVITIATSMGNLSSDTYAVLKISDNGTGIPEKNISKIYDRFFRSDFHRGREKGGYGLGLSIVKSIIDSNGGKIDVESELGVGTTFYIYLKLNK